MVMVLPFVLGFVAAVLAYRRARAARRSARASRRSSSRCGGCSTTPPTSSPSRSRTAMQRTLDTLALYGICAVLGVAFYYQFGLGELPCPLCALQRVGFVVAGVGADAQPARRLLACALRARAAVGRRGGQRVVAPDLAARDPGHRPLRLGAVRLSLLHLGVRGLRRAGRLRRRNADDRAQRRRARARAHPPARRRKLACWMFMLLAAANAAAFLRECGLGPCPDNPTGYLWWPASELAPR